MKIDKEQLLSDAKALAVCTLLGVILYLTGCNPTSCSSSSVDSGFNEWTGERHTEDVIRDIQRLNGYD